jgi:heptosyltransferase-2
MPNWLGDAVMALPALDHLAWNARKDADWPFTAGFALLDLAAEITRKDGGWPVAVACKPSLFDLFRARPCVDALLDAAARPESWRRRAPAGALAAAGAGEAGVERVRRALAEDGGRFRLGVLFTNSFSSAWQMWRTGTSQRYGYARDARRWLLRPAVPCLPATRSAHMAGCYHDLAEYAALEASPVDVRPQARDGGLPIPQIHPPPEGLAEASRLREEWGLGGACAVLAPLSAYGSVKDWPAERYAELAARLAAGGRAVIITGAPGQEAACEDIRRMAGAAIHNGAGRTTLGGLLGLLAGADVFVGGDSGAAHAAAALGIRTVAIFGVTDPSRTRPLGRDVRVVGAPVGQAIPRLNTARARAAAREALAAISVERVWEAVKRG